MPVASAIAAIRENPMLVPPDILFIRFRTHCFGSLLRGRHAFELFFVSNDFCQMVVRLFGQCEIVADDRDASDLPILFQGIERIKLPALARGHDGLRRLVGLRVATHAFERRGLLCADEDRRIRTAGIRRLTGRFWAAGWPERTIATMGSVAKLGGRHGAWNACC